MSTPFFIVFWGWCAQNIDKTYLFLACFSPFSEAGCGCSWPSGESRCQNRSRQGEGAWWILRSSIAFRTRKSIQNKHSTCISFSDYRQGLGSIKVHRVAEGRTRQKHIRVPVPLTRFWRNWKAAATTAPTEEGKDKADAEKQAQYFNAVFYRFLGGWCAQNIDKTYLFLACFLSQFSEMRVQEHPKCTLYTHLIDWLLAG